MLFFGLRWFREEREETTDRHVLNHICDSGWLANVILQKWDHSPKGQTQFPPTHCLLGDLPCLCLFRWLDQSLLSLLEELLKGFSGLWITHRRSSQGNGALSTHTPSVPGSSQPTQSCSSAEPSLAQETQERNPL